MHIYIRASYYPPEYTLLVMVYYLYAPSSMEMCCLYWWREPCAYQRPAKDDPDHFGDGSLTHMPTQRN